MLETESAKDVTTYETILHFLWIFENINNNKIVKKKLIMIRNKNSIDNRGTGKFVHCLCFFLQSYALGLNATCEFRSVRDYVSRYSR